MSESGHDCNRPIETELIIPHAQATYCCKMYQTRSHWSRSLASQFVVAQIQAGEQRQTRQKFCQSCCAFGPNVETCEAQVLCPLHVGLCDQLDTTTARITPDQLVTTTARITPFLRVSDKPISWHACFQCVATCNKAHAFILVNVAHWFDLPHAVKVFDTQVAITTLEVHSATVQTLLVRRHKKTTESSTADKHGCSPSIVFTNSSLNRDGVLSRLEWGKRVRRRERRNMLDRVKRIFKVALAATLTWRLTSTPIDTVTSTFGHVWHSIWSAPPRTRGPVCKNPEESSALNLPDHISFVPFLSMDLKTQLLHLRAIHVLGSPHLL
jgi:hypothetical protein